MTLDVAWAIGVGAPSAQTVTEHRHELIELDRQIGDGDHGENLYRGFTAVVAKLDALEEPPADDRRRAQARRDDAHVHRRRRRRPAVRHRLPARGQGHRACPSSTRTASSRCSRPALEGIVARGKADAGREDDGRRVDARGRGRGRRGRLGRDAGGASSRAAAEAAGAGAEATDPADRDEGPRELPRRALAPATATRVRARPR